MNKEMIRVGLIGLGMIGKVHARAYHQLQSANLPGYPQVELTILVRPGHPREDDFLAGIGSPVITDSLEDFFASQPDLVDICTPNDSHAFYTERACRMGASIYCEKPLGCNLEEARQMAAMARQAGILTHVAFTYRYVPAFRQLIASAQAGDIGRPFYFRTSMFHAGYLDPGHPLTWRLQRSKAGGGVLADMGIHLIDLLRAALGEFSWVQCEAQTFIKDRPLAAGSDQKRSVDVDDWAICILGNEKRTSGSLEVSRLASGRHQTSFLEIYGEKGSLSADFSRWDQALIYHPEVAEWHPVDREMDVPRLQIAESHFQKAHTYTDFTHTAHLASIEDFILLIRQGKASPMDFASAEKDQQILEAAYRSAQEDGVRIDL
jgi:predicted dehydrogenase